MSMRSAIVPAFDENNSSGLTKFTMQEHHNPHHETLASGSFMQGFSDSILPEWHLHACSHDCHCLGQHEDVNYNGDEGMQRLLDNSDSWMIKAIEPQPLNDMVFDDMWENLIYMTSESQAPDIEVFDAPSLACISALHDLSSQTSSNSLPISTDAIGTRAIDTSLQPSLESFLALPQAPNDHGLQSFGKNEHVNEHLGTSIHNLMALYPSLLEMDLMPPVSPPPSINGKAAAHQPLSRSKAKVSSHKIKPTGTKRVKKNEKAETVLAESTRDGYMWCKYGQKRIKNRMHPRAYFRCAHSNCPVKKQMENSCDMPGFLLIKYFGKHNH